mmetsp:Transcript_19825/g.42226  ORF Transcript_19825/g.42226 Transcript_19825/m.42226 type:complete len:227 (-) Transcript_19825:781-1461(-)
MPLPRCPPCTSPPPPLSGPNHRARTTPRKSAQPPCHHPHCFSPAPPPPPALVAPPHCAGGLAGTGGSVTSSSGLPRPRCAPGTLCEASPPSMSPPSRLPRPGAQVRTAKAAFQRTSPRCHPPSNHLSDVRRCHGELPDGGGGGCCVPRSAAGRGPQPRHPAGVPCTAPPPTTPGPSEHPQPTVQAQTATLALPRTPPHEALQCRRAWLRDGGGGFFSAECGRGPRL